MLLVLLVFVIFLYLEIVPIMSMVSTLMPSSNMFPILLQREVQLQFRVGAKEKRLPIILIPLKARFGCRHGFTTQMGLQNMVYTRILTTELMDFKKQKNLLLCPNPLKALLILLSLESQVMHGLTM